MNHGPPIKIYLPMQWIIKWKTFLEMDWHVGAYKCIYWIECSICFLAQYLGKTGNIKTRGRQHVNAIDMLDDNGNFVHNNKLYEHFRLPGHSHRNMRIFVLEEVFGDDNILKAREDYWIMKCNSLLNHSLWLYIIICLN